MLCAVCKAETPVMEHQFIKGTPTKPEKTWMIVAPLYFKANEDNTACVEGYCGAVCSNSERPI